MVNNPVYFSKRDIKIYRYKKKKQKKKQSKEIDIIYCEILGSFG
jgi:hypothetical protein